jgi:VCBS repeat-containing protein
VTGSIIANTGATLSVSATKTVALDDVTVNGGSITDNGTVHVDTARTLTLNGVTVTGGNLTNDGTIETAATTSMNGVGITNAGTIEATSGVLKVTGSVQGSGSIQVDAGAFLELDATVAATQKIVFNGAGSSEVQLDASTFGGQIQGMAATDEIDLRTIGYGLSTTGTYVSNANNDGGVLTITDGTHSISMTLVGDYRHAHFAGASDGHGGTLITLNAADDGPTFAAGETTQTGTFDELSDTTGSSASNPVPALTGSVHFTDLDLFDRPSATITSQTVTWNDHATDLSSSLSQAQIDALEHALLLQQSGNTNNGAIGWTYSISDSALDFLAAGQTATVKSIITLDDHEGGKDTASVTITVTGANDAPVAVADTNVGHIVEAGGNNNGLTGVSTTTGAVLANDTDVDLSDTHHVIGVAKGTVNGVLTSGVGTIITGTYGSLVLNDNGTWTYTLDNTNPLTDALAQGVHASDIFSYTESDYHGGTSTTTLTIDVTGTNDAPAAAPDINSGAPVTERGVNPENTAFAGVDTASGNVLTNDLDVDTGDSKTVQGVANGTPTGPLTGNVASGVTGAFGSVTIDANGAWTYTLDNNSTATQALKQGDHAFDVFTYTMHDAHGATSSATLTIDVTGANDAPTLDAVTKSLADTAINDSFATITGTLVGYDADSGETATLVYAALDSGHAVNSAVTGLYGSLTVDDHGHYKYVADAAAVNALHAGSYYDTFTVQTADAHGATRTATFTVNITGVNDAPLFAGHDLASTYHAGGNAVAIVDTVSASDIDSANYAGGSLTATVTQGGHTGDTLSIAGNQYIVLNGTAVMFDADGDGSGAAVAIGTLTDGINSLKIDLNANATDAAVAKLAQAIEFRNTMAGAETGDRTVTFTLHDGDGTANGGLDSSFFNAKVTVESIPTSLVIETDRFHISEDGNGVTTVTGLYFADTAPSDATTSITLTTATGASPASGAAPSTDMGSLAHINATLSNGVTYDPGLNQPQTDSLVFTVADTHGGTDTVHFIFNQAGSGPDITLTGTSGKDVIFATENTDILTGGAGADQFVFRTSDGLDTITDFAPGQDHIDLRAFSAIDTSNIGDWLSSHAATSQANPADVLITVDADKSILLHNVALNSLHTSDFIVSPHA